MAHPQLSTIIVTRKSLGGGHPVSTPPMGLRDSRSSLATSANAAPPKGLRLGRGGWAAHSHCHLDGRRCQERQPGLQVVQPCTNHAARHTHGFGKQSRRVPQGFLESGSALTLGVFDPSKPAVKMTLALMATFANATFKLRFKRKRGGMGRGPAPWRGGLEMGRGRGRSGVTLRRSSWHGFGILCWKGAGAG